MQTDAASPCGDDGERHRGRRERWCRLVAVGFPGLTPCCLPGTGPCAARETRDDAQKGTDAQTLAVLKGPEAAAGIGPLQPAGV